MSRRDEDKKRKKKKREKDWELMIFDIMEKSLTKALDASMKELFKGFK